MITGAFNCAAVSITAFTEELEDINKNSNLEVDEVGVEDVPQSPLILENIDIHHPKTTVKVLTALARKRKLRTRGLKKDKIIALIIK